MKQGVPSLLSIAVINITTQKQRGEEGVYLAYASTSSWKARAETVVAIAHWLVGHDLYTTQAYLLSCGTIHRSLGSPTLVVSQRKDPQTCPWANLMEAGFSLERLSSQVIMLSSHKNCNWHPGFIAMASFHGCCETFRTHGSPSSGWASPIFPEQRISTVLMKIQRGTETQGRLDGAGMG